MLSSKDWLFLEHMQRFFIPFKEVILKLEGHCYTLDTFQPSMEFL